MMMTVGLDISAHLTRQLESEGRTVMLTIRHLAQEPSFPYLYHFVGDLLQPRAALPRSHLHLKLPSAGVNLAPAVLVSVLSDTQHFKPGSLFDGIYRFSLSKKCSKETSFTFILISNCIPSLP